MKLNRRRLLAISAAYVAGAGWAKASSAVTEWRGLALGADASIKLRGNPETVNHALVAARDTIERMGRLFSLYDPNSALSKLNQNSVLSMPPEFARLVHQVSAVHKATDGLFDPTIQPLFAAMLRHGGQLPPKLLGQLKSKVGWDQIDLSGFDIRFKQPEMAMTLNGIAQGFATDRVSEVLKSHGFENIAVDIGEYRAGSEDILLGIQNHRGKLLAKAQLQNRSIATSSPIAFTFDNGAEHTILPTTGLSHSRWSTVSVVAPTATLADGISTALCLANGTGLAKRLVEKGLINSVLMESRHGQLIKLGDFSII